MQSQKEALYSSEEPQRRESITDLIGDLASQSAGLVRDEMALAKQEFSEKLASLRPGAITLVLGAGLAMSAFLVLCAAAVAGLAEYMKVWQAALIVGGVLAIIAGALVAMGAGRLSKTSLKPRKTLKSLEENKEWLKEIT
jgi:cytochrome c biogenesis protein CcdA